MWRNCNINESVYVGNKKKSLREVEGGVVVEGVNEQVRTCERNKNRCGNFKIQSQFSAFFTGPNFCIC